jgi:hypothetical protein
MKQLFTLIALSFFSVVFAQTFDIIGSELPQLANSISSFGDADGDGDLDLYLAGFDPSYNSVGGLYLYEDGTYSLSTFSNLPILSLGVARWSDIDADGDLDVVLMGFDGASGTGVLDIYLNDSGVFTALNAGLYPGYMGDVAVVDFNNDSHLDIAMTGFGDAWETKLYKNNGDTTFTEMTSVSLPPMNMGHIKFADYDNDGNQDFVLNGLNETTDDYYTVIYKNNGDETFTEETGIELMQRWIGDMDWGDFNNDGNIDLVISGTGGESGMERNTVVYKNNGDGSFTNINATIMGVSHSALAWEDFDNDGLLDLLVLGTFTTPGEGNYIREIYKNNGDETFSPSTYTELSTCYYGDADTGDIDGDGKIDIVITGFDQSDVAATHVYKNTTTVGINEQNIFEFNMYPNPNTNRLLTIDCQFDVTVSIVNLTGAIVYNSDINQHSSINLSHLNAGTYIVSVESDKATLSKKLILK